MDFPVVAAVVVAAAAVVVAAAVAGIPLAVEAAVGFDSAVGEDHTHWGRVGVEGLERGDSEAESRAGSCLDKMETRQARNWGVGNKTRRKGWERMSEWCVWLRDVRGGCGYTLECRDVSRQEELLRWKWETLYPRGRVRLIPSVARNTSIHIPCTST